MRKYLSLIDGLPAEINGFGKQGLVTIEYDSTALEVDTNPVKLTFEMSNEFDHFVIAKWDDDESRTLATYELIGNNSTLDFAQIEGKRLILNAGDKSWFNIKHNTTATFANHRKINTGLGRDLHFLRKAEFVYRDSSSEWLLVSFENASWGRINNINASNSFSSTQTITFNPFPVAGFYEFDIFVQVSQKDMSNNHVNTENLPTLSAYNLAHVTTGSYGLIGTAHTFVEGGSSALDKLITHSLQGSGIIRATTSDLASQFNVTLPNGANKEILGGYCHFRFIGRELT
jgi:hypothetical protein